MTSFVTAKYDGATPGTPQVVDPNVPVQSPIIVIGTAAPSNNDGRPDGTIYIQTVS